MGRVCFPLSKEKGNDLIELGRNYLYPNQKRCRDSCENPFLFQICALCVLPYTGVDGRRKINL